MTQARQTPDGLPFRVYEHYDVRVYSIGYKMKSGTWAFRYQCSKTDLRAIAQLRKQATSMIAKTYDRRKHKRAKPVE